MRPSGSDLRLLQVFDAVVRNGGFAAAEAELNLSQSTISNHMTALEQRLGVVLCQRGRRGFRLTEQGRAIHEAAIRLDAALHDFVADVGSVRGQLSGELRLGILDAVADDPANRLPQALAAFRAQAGEVKLMVGQERAQDLQQKVRDGVYHCGIGVLLNAVDGLDSVALHQESHGLYCGRGHPLFAVADAEVTPDDVRRHAFVHRGYWHTEDTLHHPLGPVEATVFQIEPQLLLIRSGGFIGFLPDHYAARWCEAGEVRRLAPQHFGYISQFHLFAARDARKTNVVTAFMEAAAAAWDSSATSPAAAAAGPASRQ